MNNLYFVNAEVFLKFQNAKETEFPNVIKNPFYDLDNITERYKPYGGIWAYSQDTFQSLDDNEKINDKYIIMYPISHPNPYTNLYLEDKYKRKNIKGRIRKLGRGIYDLDYENISRSYDFIKFTNVIEYFNTKDKRDVLITNLKAFRVLRVVNSINDLFTSDIHNNDNGISDRFNEYCDAIKSLDITDNLKNCLNRSFGFNYVNGNFLCIDDIVYDIKYNDGRFIKNKTPNLGVTKYDNLKKALFKAGYITDEYLILNDPKTAIVKIEVPVDKVDLLTRYCNEMKFEIKKVKY